MKRNKKKRRRAAAVGAGLLGWVAARNLPLLRKYMKGSAGREYGDSFDAAGGLPGKGEEKF